MSFCTLVISYSKGCSFIPIRYRREQILDLTEKEYVVADRGPLGANPSRNDKSVILGNDKTLCPSQKPFQTTIRRHVDELKCSPFR